MAEGRASPPTIGGWNPASGELPSWDSIASATQRGLDAAAARAEEARQKSLELAATTRENLSPHLAKFDEATASARSRIAEDASNLTRQLSTAFQPPSMDVENPADLQVAEESGEPQQASWWAQAQPPVEGEEAVSLLDKMSSFGEATKKVMGETGAQLAGSFKDATEDRQECGLTRTQRFRWYVILLGVSTLFFGLALQFLPLAVIKPTKFASAFCIGTVCSVAAKFMLNGPRTQLRLMVEWRKLPYSLALVASTALTLYACFYLGNFLLVVFASVSQVAALLYYLSGDTPGGISGVKFLGTVIVKTVRLILSPCLAALNGD
jgi:hypothetical protein